MAASARSLSPPSPDVTRRHPSSLAVAHAAIAAWLILYSWRTVVGHLSFATNAYDLSVFDQALWSLTHGGRGFVPFLGQSIFSHHFMPILWIIAPIHAAAPWPLTLLELQLVATAAAAVMFLQIQQRQGLDGWIAAALTLTFLLSRRTHGAVAGTFYPESFQALLTFAMVWWWRQGRWFLWMAVVLLLMTKEDAALYVAGYAFVSWIRSDGPRRRTLAVAGVAVMWFAIALLVAIPRSRAADGLGASNPLLEERYAATAGQVDIPSLAARVASASSARTILNIAASGGFLPVLGWPWIAPAAVGLVANLAAAPGSMQSTLMGHYAWPVLPWVFLATAAGALVVQRRSRTWALVWSVVLLIVSAADNPALQRLGSTSVSVEARQLRAQLARMSGETMVVQPNLMPHMPKTRPIYAIGGADPPVEPDLILLTTVGDLWPMTPDEVRARISAYQQDARYVEIESGPLYAFRRK